MGAWANEEWNIPCYGEQTTTLQAFVRASDSPLLLLPFWIYVTLILYTVFKSLAFMSTQFINTSCQLKLLVDLTFGFVQFTNGFLNFVRVLRQFDYQFDLYPALCFSWSSTSSLSLSRPWFSSVRTELIVLNHLGNFSSAKPEPFFVYQNISVNWFWYYYILARTSWHLDWNLWTVSLH